MPGSRSATCEERLPECEDIAIELSRGNGALGRQETRDTPIDPMARRKLVQLTRSLCSLAFLKFDVGSGQEHN